MYMDEIMKGESSDIEYKEALPENSSRYMKTVVAFANSSGGRLIFGVRDGTREVVGIDSDDIFKVCDSVANAIADSCKPAVIPDITMRTVEGKTLVIVDIPEGRQRPYYIKSMGIEHGVYVRVAATSRPADEDMIRELMFEGSGRHFDQTLCMGMQVTDDDITRLCDAMKSEAQIHAKTDEQKAAVKDVTVNQLLSWGILTEKDGVLCPTNAYPVLIGDESMPSSIQCAVFKGSTRTVFVDSREYTGTLWEQVKQAYQFVLRNIHMSAEFNGLHRRSVYEIPSDVIRELIVNAAVHRSYIDRGHIQVAIYDDRLEVTSPGKLMMGQNLRRMKYGHSKIRNEAIAKAFAYMNLMEQWGSGIPRIIDRTKEAGLREPEFIDLDVDLRVNIYRKQQSGIPCDQGALKDGTIEVREPETAYEAQSRKRPAGKCFSWRLKK